MNVSVKTEPVDNYWQNVNIKTEPTDQSELPPAPPPKKKRGRQKKLKQELITDLLPVKKERKKRDRFNGMPEEEVLQRLLPDHLAPNLDIVIVGINPGLYAAYVGHHYAGPGNHFWKCMYLSGLIPEPMNASQDFKLKEYGIGFTNIVARTTRGSADLNRKEIKEGAQILVEKLREFKPKIAVFNGKGIYEVFCGHKNFHFGRQPEKLDGTETTVYVMPSSSARCSQLPRAVDKVPFYAALKKLRDHLNGHLPDLQDSEVYFPDLELKTAVKTEKKEMKEEFGENFQEFGGEAALSQVSAEEWNQISQHAQGTFSAVKQEMQYNPNDYGGNGFSNVNQQQLVGAINDQGMGINSQNIPHIGQYSQQNPQTVSSQNVFQQFHQGNYSFPNMSQYMLPQQVPQISNGSQTFQPPYSQYQQHLDGDSSQMYNCNNSLASMSQMYSQYFQPGPTAGMPQMSQYSQSQVSGQYPITTSFQQSPYNAQSLQQGSSQTSTVPSTCSSFPQQNYNPESLSQGSSQNPSTSSGPYPQQYNSESSQHGSQAPSAHCEPASQELSESSQPSTSSFPYSDNGESHSMVTALPSQSSNVVVKQEKTDDGYQCSSTE